MDENPYQASNDTDSQPSRPIRTRSSRTIAGAIVMLAGAAMISGSLMTQQSAYQSFVGAVGWLVGAAGVVILIVGLFTEFP